MRLISLRRNPLFTIGIFFISVAGVWMAEPASSASAECGVTTGRVSSLAGAVIEANWRRYSDGAILEARNSHIYVENADWRGDLDGQYGNIMHLNSSNIAIAGEGVESGQFGQYASGCGDGYNVVLGYTTTSGRYLGGGNYQWGPWALDCDASATSLGYGIGNERYFRARGVEVPTGARAGGTWSTVTFQPPNGYTSYLSVTYTEPAPPDSLPIGNFDAMTCDAIWGWAFDPDNSGYSIPIHFFVDGTGPYGTTANQSRPDVNAAYGIGGNHGFSYDISGWVSDGGTHSISVHAIGINSSGTANARNTFLGTKTVSGCYNYALTPSVNTSSTTAVVGQTVNFNYYVVKNGPSPTRTTAVAIKQYVVAPGQTFNASVGMLDNVNSNCDTRYSPTLCATTWQLPSRTFPGGLTTVTTVGSIPAYVPVNTAAFAPGTKVCQMLAIDPATGSMVRNRWSAPVCVVIAKKPYTAIKNGDAWAGGTFKSSTGTCTVAATARGFEGSNVTFPDGRTYGSYGEYGVSALKNVTNFGSAGKPVGTKQTFRNTPVPLGNFSTTTNNCLNDALAYYGTKPVTLTVSGSAPLANFGSGVYATTASDNGTVTVTTGAAKIDITLGKHIVLIANGDIFINKNIEFAPGPYANLNDIPSLTVISRNGNIRISQAVTRLDGFYQAKGSFITCAESPTGSIGENNNLCKNQLTVNGAVSASKFVLRRINGGSSVGGVDRRNEPAEQFIMRPDVFLSQYGQSQNTNQLRSVDENELPPRY